jgi:5-formyltetrahydrofolate cyclo-ligase
MHPLEEKQILRQSIKERLLRLSDHDRLAESRTVCRQIRKALPKEPVPIAAYFPLKDEVDLRPLLDELLKEGWPVFIPGIEHGVMVFRKIASTMDLHVGKFTVLEPPRDAPLLDPSTLQVALIPGRAFDALGNRLGRGNGGYDRWIRQQRVANPKTRFWGICLELQVVHHVPMQEHDERMDSLVTARGQTVVV